MYSDSILTTQGEPMPVIDIQELLEGGQEDTPSFIKTTKQEMVSHQVFLDSDIGEPAQYRDLINLLYVCSDLTEFNIFVNSSGGQLNSASAIIEAIKACDGKVRAIITGECHSAASMIALNCHEIIVCDSAHALIHTASYGTGGSAGNVKAHTDFSTKYINKLIDTTYTGFLSASEIEEIKKGVEIWLDADEIRARLTNRMEYLKAKSEAENQELIEEADPVPPKRKPRKDIVEEVVDTPKRRTRSKKTV